MKKHSRYLELTVHSETYDRYVYMHKPTGEGYGILLRDGLCARYAFCRLQALAH